VSFPIDPGTVPPLTGPGVVAGWYRVLPSNFGSSLYIHLWDGNDPESCAKMRVATNGEIWTQSRRPCSEALTIAWNRLGQRLDSHATEWHARTKPVDFTDEQLCTWLRELNLHPIAKRPALETT